MGRRAAPASTSTKSTTTTSAIPAPPKPPPNAEEGTVFVSLGSAAGLGQVLVDSEGHTLYAFSEDSAEASTCEGACAKAWPPLLVEQGEPQPSNGASAARLGTITRADGSRQVTYAGHPLYTYSGDKQPGEANGNGSSRLRRHLDRPQGQRRPRRLSRTRRVRTFGRYATFCELNLVRGRGLPRLR